MNTLPSPTPPRIHVAPQHIGDPAPPRHNEAWVTPDGYDWRVAPTEWERTFGPYIGQVREVRGIEDPEEQDRAMQDLAVRVVADHESKRLEAVDDGRTSREFDFGTMDRFGGLPGRESLYHELGGLMERVATFRRGGYKRASEYGDISNWRKAGHNALRILKLTGSLATSQAFRRDFISKGGMAQRVAKKIVAKDQKPAEAPQN